MFYCSTHGGLFGGPPVVEVCPGAGGKDRSTLLASSYSILKVISDLCMFMKQNEKRKQFYVNIKVLRTLCNKQLFIYILHIL